VGGQGESNTNAMSVVNYAISLRAYVPFRTAEIIFVPERNAFCVASALNVALSMNRHRFCNYLMYSEDQKMGFLTNNKTKAQGVNSLQRCFLQNGIKLYAPFRSRLMDEWRNTLRELNLHVQSFDPESKKRVAKYHASMGGDDRVMTLVIGNLVMGTFMGPARALCIRNSNGEKTLCNCGRGIGHDN
jgi:hypothetical protein